MLKDFEIVAWNITTLKYCVFNIMVTLGHPTRNSWLHKLVSQGKHFAKFCFKLETHVTIICI